MTKRHADPGRRWPITMAEAARIASIPEREGTDEEIAHEYGVVPLLVRDIRVTKSFNGVNLSWEKK